MRNLFKRVLLVLDHMKTKDTFNIDIEYFKIAVEFSAKKPFEIDEVACILGNLF
jgi:hypothetical protein